MDAELEKTDCDALHLVKLCVGTDTVEDLAEWQVRLKARREKEGLDPRPRHVTRMWPRRSDEILGGGSLYWVVKGLILVRQRIVDLEETVGEDGIRRCGIVLDPKLIRTEPRPRSAFQGWRYFPPRDAPPDLDARSEAELDMPADMRAALLELGVIGR